MEKENNGKVFCVDAWTGSPETYLEDIAEQADVFQQFWTNIKKSGYSDIVIPIRCSSDVARIILKPNFFDLIFIDGDHRYDQSYKDMKYYYDLVKDGGIFLRS